jgi:hypothetical protein
MLSLRSVFVFVLSWCWFWFWLWFLFLYFILFYFCFGFLFSSFPPSVSHFFSASSSQSIMKNALELHNSTVELVAREAANLLG